MPNNVKILKSMTRLPPALPAAAAIYFLPIWHLFGNAERISTILEYVMLAVVLGSFFFVLRSALQRRRAGAAPSGEDTTPEAASAAGAAALIIALFIAVQIVFSVRAFGSLQLGAYDYTGISSVIASLRTSGKLLDSAYYASQNGSTFYVAHHFSPLLAIYIPFYYFADTHLAYGILLQATLAAGLFGFYRLTRLYVRDSAESFLLVLCLLFYPFFYSFTIAFHYEILVLPASMLFFYGIKKENNVLTVLGLVSLCFIKEDIPAYLACFGAYLTTRRQTRTRGIFVFLFSVAFFLFVTAYLMPQLSGERESRFLSYWSDVGAGQKDLFLQVLGQPRRVLLAFWENRGVVVRLFAPLCFLPLLRGRLALFVFVPILAIHFLSNQPYFRKIEAYYGYTILPFIVYGLLEAHERARRFLEERFALPEAGALLCLLLFAFTVRAAALNRMEPYHALPPGVPAAAVREILKSVPPGSSVHTHSFLSTQVKLANPVFGLGDTSQRMEYVLIEEGRWTPQAESAARVALLIRRLEKSATVVRRLGKFTLYRVQ